MNRKQFIKTCGFACLSATGLSLLLQSCGATKHINAPISGSNLVIPVSDFEVVKHTHKTFKKHVILQNDELKYPICVFRFDETNYTALLMSCPHQGAELQVFGDKLQCPAHGSELQIKALFKIVLLILISELFQ